MKLPDIFKKLIKPKKVYAENESVLTLENKLLFLVTATSDKLEKMDEQLKKQSKQIASIQKKMLVHNKESLNQMELISRQKKSILELYENKREHGKLINVLHQNINELNGTIKSLTIEVSDFKELFYNIEAIKSEFEITHQELIKHYINHKELIKSLQETYIRAIEIQAQDCVRLMREEVSKIQEILRKQEAK